MSVDHRAEDSDAAHAPWASVSRVQLGLVRWLSRRVSARLTPWASDGPQVVDRDGVGQGVAGDDPPWSTILTSARSAWVSIRQIERRRGAGRMGGAAVVVRSDVVGRGEPCPTARCSRPSRCRSGRGCRSRRGSNEPEPSLEKVTVPVGVVAPAPLSSVTVAVHEVVAPASTGVAQLSDVDVVRRLTWWAAPALTLPVKLALPAIGRRQGLRACRARGQDTRAGRDRAETKSVPSETVTLPVGLPAPGAITTTLKVTV